MKKVIFSLAAITLVVLGTSCSKSCNCTATNDMVADEFLVNAENLATDENICESQNIAGALAGYKCVWE